MDTKKHFWRIAIIMAHDGETFFEYNDLEQSILDQRKFENLSYVIFYHNQEYKRNSIRELISNEYKRAPYFKRHEKSKEFEELDFYDENVFGRFLKEVVAFTCSGEDVCHYLIITWGHGGGLVYYPPLDLIVKILKSSGLYEYDGFTNKDFLKTFLDSVKVNILKYAFLKANFSIAAVEQAPPFIDPSMFVGKTMLSPEFLEKINKVNRFIENEVKLYTAVQLNRIFKASFSTRIDIYFALNCYTQMIETGYELAESVDMMIASQTAMPFTGINYYSLFNKLEENPGLDTRVVATEVPEDFNLKYTYKPFINVFKKRYPKFPLSGTSFSCNSLDRYDAILPCINRLEKLLRDIYDSNNVSYNQAASFARYNCRDLSLNDTHGLIDLTNFFNQLEIHLPGPLKSELIEIKHEFALQRQQCMASMRYATSEYYSSKVPSDSPYFLSIFAPAFESPTWLQFLLDIYPTLATKFSISSCWDEFVPTFYRNTHWP